MFAFIIPMYQLSENDLLNMHRTERFQISYKLGN